MSYDLEDLRTGIVELFLSVAQTGAYRVDYNELPARVSIGMNEAQRAEHREQVREAKAISRARRALERASLPWPYYRCPLCHSQTSAHRCPG